MQRVRQDCRTNFGCSTTGAGETGQGLFPTEEFANVHALYSSHQAVPVWNCHVGYSELDVVHAPQV